MFFQSARQDAVLCLSFANLCFLRVWAEAPPYVKPEVEFLFTAPLPAAYYVSGIASTLLFAVGLFACVQFLRRLDRPPLTPWVQRLFLLGLLIPINSVINATPGFTAWFRPVTLARAVGQTGGFIAGCCMAVLGAYCLFRPPRRLLSAGRVALFLLSPLAPLTLGTAAWRSGQSVSAASSHRPAPVAARHKPAASRVVWIILDEWDFRLSFVDREKSLRLPVIDQLARQSFFATNAAPPAAWTKVSIVSLLTGTAWQDVRPTDSGGLRLMASQKNGRLWDSESNVLLTARQQGWRSAVVGWHLPYCRLLETEGPDCWSWESSFSVPNRSPELVGNMVLQFRQLAETKNRSLFGQPNRYYSLIATQKELTERAESVASNSAYDLVFIHLPILHRPHFYDRQTGDYTLRGNPFRGYIDALELADAVLGRILDKMQAKGVLEETALLVTADHWCRTSDLIDGKTDRRVPFLLKFPRQSQQREYDAPFNTVCTRGVVEAILSGRIRHAEGLAGWLNRASASGDAKNWQSLPVELPEGETVAP